MLLAFDVGNTNITAGAFDGARLVKEWRLPTEGGVDLGALRGLRSFSFSGAAAASVVPSVDAALSREVRRCLGLKTVWVMPSSPLGLRYRVKNPREVGADRVANAVAAIGLFGAPAVVIDFGTATTFDCVSARREYLGGAILPGPRMAARALSEQTAKLPLVAVARPRRVVGRDTVECIQGGLYFGYLGMIENILKLTLREMRAPKARVLATGGLASLFAADLPQGTEIVPDLTLQGVRISYDILMRIPCSSRNKKASSSFR